MCQFCITHGEGEKWYLKAKNYSEDLLSDLKRRRYIEEFVTDVEGKRRGLGLLASFDSKPAILRRMAGKVVTKKMQKKHFGQVVPIEDVEKILATVTSVVRVACLCRKVNGRKEGRYCYGLSIAPEGGEMAKILKNSAQSFMNGPEAGGMEVLTREEALKAMKGHEAEGLCHSVWTFLTPFIGAICNCDRADCLAMRISVGHEIPIMFRAEYVAVVDEERCAGCRECMKICPFGAVEWSASAKEAKIDLRHCYGCGICRSACPADAISLKDRREEPQTAQRWL